MKRLTHFIYSFYFLIPALLLGQDNSFDSVMMARIREEGMTHSQIPMIAHQLTDVAGPRLTNSTGFKRAANWAVTTMKSWGLANAQMEDWGQFGRGWELQKSYAAMSAPYYQPIIAYPVAWTSGTKGLIKAPVVLLDKLDSATIKKHAAEIKNAIVLLSDGTMKLRSAFNAYATRYTDSQVVRMGDTYWITRKMVDFYIPFIRKRKNVKAYLMQQGPAAVLIENGEGRDGTIFVDGTSAYKKDETPGKPQLVISTEDFLKLRRLTEGGTKVQLELEVKVGFLNNDLRGHNVVAEIPGVDPQLKSELVIIGGHLDSWHSGTGATDNGAGCIVMMEVMRILRSLGVQPKRTIRITLWDGEEQGLYGSYNYVRNHFADVNTMELKPDYNKVSAYYNLDNGSGKIRGIFTQNNQEVVPIFKSWLAPFADLGASTVTTKNTGSTDHQAFDEVGIPGFQFIQDPLEYETRTHHSNMDTYDHLQIDDLKQAAVIIAAFVYNTAMRDQKIPRKPMPAPGKWIFDGLD